MRNIKRDVDDSLRAVYTRSDFGEMIQGRHAATPVEFSELVRILLACIGEDEGVKFINQSLESQAAGNSNDWTYAIDDANQITLRYWVNELEYVEERISTQCCITAPEERTKLQNLLLDHVRTLKARAHGNCINRDNAADG